MKTLTKILLGLTVVGSLTIASATSGADLYNKCSACHGVNGEKKALGKSQIIQGWEIQKTVDALNGYKDGTYGGPMKGLMKAQVKSMNEEQIKALAKYISEK